MGRMGRTRDQAGQTGTARHAAAPATAGTLQSALEAEQAAVYGYGVVGAYLTGATLEQAIADWLAHRGASNTLEAMLRARGTQPAAAAVAYQLPIQVQTPAQAVSLALLIEDRIATTYLGLVAASSPAIRRLGALQLQASALRAAAWRGSTVPFPGLPAGATSSRRPGGK